MHPVDKNSSSLLRYILSPYTYIICLGILVYCNALSGGIVWDDTSIFQNIESIKNAGADGLIQGNNFNALGYFRPIGALYFSIMTSLFGTNTISYHFIQIALHIANSLMLFALFKKFINKNIALILSILFLVHPLQVESVSYISSIISVLSFTFGIIALYVTTQNTFSKFSLTSIAILLLLSVLSKEAGFLFVLLVPLYYFLFFKKHRWLGLGISGVVTIVYGLLHSMTTPVKYVTTFYVPITELSLTERLFHIPKIIVYYLTTFIYPEKLAINQLWIIGNVNFANFYFPLLVIVSLIILIFYLYLFIKKKNKQDTIAYLFFLLWFVIGLSFYLQIFPLRNTVADKWFYFPMAGLLGMMGIILKQIAHRFIAKKELWISLFILLILLLSIRTIVRNNDWHDEITLLSHDIQIEDNYQLEYNLGSDLYNVKSYQLAEYHLERSRHMYPKEVLTWYRLGLLYGIQGNRQKSEAYLRKAISMNSNFDLPYFTLAELIYQYDGPQKALPLVNQLVDKFPNKPLYVEFRDQVLSDLQKK